MSKTICTTDILILNSPNTLDPYKLIFSHPEPVIDLLKGFVKGDWLDELDFSTLEKVSGVYTSDDLRERRDDVVWRIRWGKEFIYVFLQK